MSGLDWPAGWERTPADERERCRKFQASLGDTTSDLEAEMDRMDVEEWRASIGNSHIKSNTLPQYNANPDDPGFVLRWVDDGEQFAVACDAYERLSSNVRSVYLWVHETRMRGQRPVRTGDTEFAAARLPSGESDATATTAPPHEVLGVDPDAPDAVIEGAARSLKAEAHPDAGGSREEFQRIVEAEQQMLENDDQTVRADGGRPVAPTGTASVERQESGTVETSAFADVVARDAMHQALEDIAQMLPSDATEVDVDVTVEIDAEVVARGDGS